MTHRPRRSAQSRGLWSWVPAFAGTTRSWRRDLRGQARKRRKRAGARLQRLGALVELDIGAPRIINKGKAAAERTGGEALRDGDAVGLELLEEAAQVGDVEADMIEDTALGGDHRRGVLGEAQLRAGNVGD